MSNFHEKVFFRLEVDEFGYPPSDVESVWAIPDVRGSFVVDNIPFFIRGIANGDIISASRNDNRWWFDSILDTAGHSTIRIVFFERDKIAEVEKYVVDLGCSYEESHIKSLIAIDVPPDADFNGLKAYLEQGQEADLWEYEEAVVRHS